jgi:hypothetical protein
VMEKVRLFLAGQGEETTPDAAPAPGPIPSTPRLAERRGA